MKHQKTVTLVIAAILTLALLAGCGSTAGTPTAQPAQSGTNQTSANSAQSGGTQSSDGFHPAAVPAVPDLGGMSANEWLLAQDDKIPLGGVLPSHMESRADVYKALDKVDLNDDHVKIAWLSASLGSTFFVELVGSAQKKCDEYGYEMSVYDANFDLGTQQSQIEQCLVQDIDFIVINDINIDAEQNYYRLACEAGIPVFTVGATTASPEYQLVTNILASSWTTGYEDGRYVAEKTYGQYPNGLKVGSVITQFGDADSESRMCGFITGFLEKYAELSDQAYNSKWEAAVVAYNMWHDIRSNGSAKIDGILNWEGVVTTNNIATSAAQPACAELLTAHPNLDLAIAETDSFGMAMVNEVRQTGRVPGKDILIVYCTDGGAEICKAVKDGDVLCIGSSSPYPYGEGVINLIHEIMNGYDANDMLVNNYNPTYTICAENVDQVWSEGQVYAALLEDPHVLSTAEYSAANAG